jgi:hypothetical protein
MTENSFNWIAVVSAIISGISVLIAVAAYRLNRKKWNSEAFEYAAKKPNWAEYLIDAFSITQKPDRFFVVSITLTNNSTTPGSLLDLQLAISYNQTGISSKVTLKSQKTEIGLYEIKTATTPIELSGKKSFKGTFWFRVPKEIIDAADNISYSLVFLFGDGNSKEMPISVLMEVSDAARIQQKRKVGTPI